MDRARDGASRKLSTIEKSAAWICGRCSGAKDKKLLDLGCGPGIYAELLYDQGFAVTGIDFSKRSIAYHYQNYLDMDYENAFDIAILIYCDFGVLSPQKRRTLLTKVHRALKKDGILILDVLHTPYRDSFREMQSVQYEEGGFWSPEPYAVIQRNKIMVKPAIPWNSTWSLLKRASTALTYGIRFTPGRPLSRKRSKEILCSRPFTTTSAGRLSPGRGRTFAGCL